MEGGGGGGGGGGATWEDIPRYVTRTKRVRMDRSAFMNEYGTGRNRTAAGAAKLAALGLGRYRVRRRMRRGGLGRMYRRYKGRGLYSGTGGFWSDLWGKTAGIRGQLGDMARSSTNPYLQLAGRASQMLGTGAYEDGTVSNDIVNGGTGMPVPTFAPTSAELGTVTISHKEYVADVFGPEQTAVFQNVTYGLNPALPGTFPWLSQIAANYEEYTIKQLIFTFRSSVSDFVQSNGQVGTVIIATQYNANDAPFASKQDMMEYAGAVSAKVSANIVAGVECDPAQLSGPPGKYTRSGPAPPGEDIKTYDLGTLNVATSNTPSNFNNQALGEIWVSYTIELRKPKFFVTRAQQLLTDVFYGIQTPAGPVATTQWGVGQQNRIGGFLCTQFGSAFPPNNNLLYYVFPQSFSGNVEVTISAQFDTSAGGSLRIGAGTTGAPGIIPINDMWTGMWVPSVESNSIAGTLPTSIRATNIYHMKIVSPTTANSTVDNVLVLQGVNPLGGGAVSNLSDFTIRISMYNTGLNYNRVDRPILSNPQTEQVIEFPANAGTAP